MRGTIAAVALVLLVAFALVLWAQDDGPAWDEDLPPYVVLTEPADRVRDVDPGLREIKVTFDRPMNTERSWSWIMLRTVGDYPGYRGSREPRWEKNGRTCVLSVRLRPDTVYAVGVNSFRHTGFRDAKGTIAVPHAWVFRTKKE